MNNARIYKIIILILAVLGAVWFAYSVRAILAPFVLSAVFAYLLSPFIGYLESKGLKRPVAVVSLYAAFLLVFLGLAVILIPRFINEASSFSNKLPEYTQNIKTSLGAFQNNIESKYPVIREKKLLAGAEEKIQQFAKDESGKIPDILSEVFSVFSIFILIPFITFFFTMGGKKVIDWIFQAMPSRHVETTLSVFCEIDEILSKYIRGLVIDSACVGALTIIGLLVLKVDYAVGIGCIAGLSNIIPYLGPVVGCTIAIVSGFLQYQNTAIVLKVIIMFVLVKFMDDNIFQPVIMSKGVEIHPVLIMFSVLAGAEVAGILGMLLAMPVVCVLKIVITAFMERKM